MATFTSFANLWQDLRYGTRVLRKRPGFVLTVVVVTAVGIGANTTVFSVVHAVVMAPLPYKQPDRLIRLWESNTERGLPESAVSAPNFQDWRSQQTAFEQLAASEMATFNLTGTGDPERVAAASVTANLIPALGVAPLLGRSFLDEEETPGHDRVVLLSYSLWQRQFGGDPSVLNKPIRLSGESYAVIGVMPSEFQFPATRDLWVPLGLDPARQPWRADRGNRNLSVYGRLKPKVTIDQAIAEMDVIAAQLQQRYPESNTG
jgi:putative ABC transport system permease protein